MLSTILIAAAMVAAGAGTIGWDVYKTSKSKPAYNAYTDYKNTLKDNNYEIQYFCKGIHSITKIA